MNLSEVLDGTYCDQWGDAIDHPGGYDAVKVARELEAEVERLRERAEKAENSRDLAARDHLALMRRYHAYWEAVADVRAKCNDITEHVYVTSYEHSEQRAYGAQKAAEVVLSCLDKLPRDEP